MFNIKTAGYKYRKISNNEDGIEMQETILTSDNSDEEICDKLNNTALRKSDVFKNDETLLPKSDDTLTDVEIYEVDIDGADGPQSLQTIAMKYNCSTWELKRVNNLQNNQDFFALRTIKVAAMQNSYRSELLQRHGRLLTKDGIHSLSPEQSNYSKAKHGENSDDDDAEIRPALVRHVSIRSSILNDPEGGHKFLKSMDSDLQRIRESVSNQKTSLDEVTSTLTTPIIFPPSDGQSNAASRMFVDLFKEPYCEANGKRLLGMMFFCFIVVPLVLLSVYFYKKHIVEPP